MVSTTDPDSGIYRQSGGTRRLGYLVHFAVDRAKQVVTGVLSTGAQHGDSPQLLPLLDQVREQGAAPQAVAADRGHSSAAVYHGLAERAITAFIPLPEHRPERQGYFGRDRFAYDADSDRYRCPSGAWLRLHETSSSERRYRARAEDCGSCPLRHQCTRGKARRLTINRYDEDLVAARGLQETPAAKRAAVDRRCCSERTFAEAKGSHGLRHAHARGLENLAMQALLTATVINLKRYLRAQTRVLPTATAMQLPTPRTFSTGFAPLRLHALPC